MHEQCRGRNYEAPRFPHWPRNNLPPSELFAVAGMFSQMCLHDKHTHADSQQHSTTTEEDSKDHHTRIPKSSSYRPTCALSVVLVTQGNHRHTPVHGLFLSLPREKQTLLASIGALVHCSPRVSTANLFQTDENVLEQTTVGNQLS